MRLSGVAASADVTAASTLSPAPSRSGLIQMLWCRNVTRIDRSNAASTRARAGSELSPPTATPLILTPSGIERVGVEAGAAAHARPAAAAIATSVLSKGAHSSKFPGTFRVARSRDSVRRPPYPRQPDGVRNLAARTVLVP